jgi:DNA repair exonuclease SbcCD nuclease subunit
VVVLFTADWHLKLGQKNVPLDWAKNRYKEFFRQIRIEEKGVDLHIIGGDLFDRLPSMPELELYFDFISGVQIPTIIFDGNHEATRKNKTFFTQLKHASEKLNPLVEIVDYIDKREEFSILPYCNLHTKWNPVIDLDIRKPLFTHVRGSIPPHVTPEVDLARLSQFPVVFAGDLHSHSNTQLNIVYPGSPMTTQFHRTEVKTGYLLIDMMDGAWEWKEFKLPQLIRKTVTDPNAMIPTTYNHTIYELEGDVADLSLVKNTELLDKKVIKRKTEATLILGKEMSMEEELAEYLSYILELKDETVKQIIGIFHDHSKEARVG